MHTLTSILIALALLLPSGHAPASLGEAPRAAAVSQAIFVPSNPWLCSLIKVFCRGS